MYWLHAKARRSALSKVAGQFILLHAWQRATHMERKHGDRHPCLFCKETFVRKDALDRHVAKGICPGNPNYKPKPTGPRVPRLWACDGWELHPVRRSHEQTKSAGHRFGQPPDLSGEKEKKVHEDGLAYLAKFGAGVITPDEQPPTPPKW